MSPVSKAQQKAVNKYIKENYDRVNLHLPKGRKAAIQAAADTAGQSLNGYVTQAVNDRMEREHEGPAPTCATADHGQ